MKNILIIIGNHSPQPSSVAVNFESIMSKLSLDYNIDIITNRKSSEVKKKERYNNGFIYRVDDKKLLLLEESYRLSKEFSKIIGNIHKFFVNLFFYLTFKSNSSEYKTIGWSKSSIYKLYKVISQKKKYDLIISVSLPFKTQLVGLQIKKKNSRIKWISVAYDPFYLNKEDKLRKKIIKKRKKQEQEVFKFADLVYLSPELLNIYEINELINDDAKFKSLEYKKLKKIEYKKENVNGNFLKNNKINCLFTGRFYDGIRNPANLMKLFSELNDSINLVLMTDSSLEEIKKYTINEYIPSVIDFQNRDTVKFNLLNSDILINIGNTTELQVPGKIFEYMSSGKPIIHFSKIINDPSLKYFEKYPCVLIIKEWEIENNDYVNQIEEFCTKYSGYEIPFSKLENLFLNNKKQIEDIFSESVHSLLGGR